MKITHVIVLSSFALLPACNPVSTDDINDNSSESSISSDLSEAVSSQRATMNVSYTGTVKPAGISIYMEGTHRLELADGRFILLESDSVDLNGYVDEEIEAFGSIRPTIEADAIIMNVSEVNLLSIKEESSSDESVSAAESSEASEDFSSTSQISQSSLSSVRTSSSSSSSSMLGNSSYSSVISYGIEHSAEFDARIESMANNDFAPENWTQIYCTGHIGFCVPVHKNWWYLSFGTTSSEYWHIEMSSEPLEKLHEGPIAVRLVSESLNKIGISNGDVVQNDAEVIGYRAWDDDSHFEIIADARLKTAVSYITDKLSVYTEE